jgi:hypothetical protein
LTTPQPRSRIAALRSSTTVPGALLTGLLLALTACGRDGAEPVSAGTYVGDAVCVSCHVDQRPFAGTAHHLTSTFPSEQTVLGSFREGENVLRTANPYLHYRMEARPDGLFQSAVLGTPPDTTVFSERFGIVVGSGRKGQSYLSWRDESLLFQLPVSYWTELDHWVHSPRYPDGALSFGRAVHPRCLECHATYVQRPPEAVEANRFDPASAIVGTTGEMCQGGGRKHFPRQDSWLRRFRGQAIVNPARLGRGRQIDGCALCHGGIGEPLAPSFTYLPVRPLSEHLRQPAPPPQQAVDVHGNQVALLQRSPCFQGSEMTCATCHDVHQTQRDPAEIAATCLTCHQPQSCGRFPEHGMELVGNCVGCHMPELPSNTIISSHEGRSVRPSVRTHWIRVYESDELREATGVPF